jgi:membrane protease YdiL (CAAX protease family)
VVTSTPALPEPDLYRRIASPLHTLFILAMVGVLAFLGKINSDHMRAAVHPDRVALYERILFLEWLGFAIVILGVLHHGSPLRSVLGDRWRSARQVLRDVGIAAALFVVSIMFDAIVGPHAHGSGVDPAVQFLLPHGALEITLWIAVSITAGICEEALYRGYLQRQFMAMTGSVPAGILLSAAAFGTAHAYQGLRLAVQIGLLGALSGIVAYRCRSVRPGMIAHASRDVLAILVSR